MDIFPARSEPDPHRKPLRPLNSLPDPDPGSAARTKAKPIRPASDRTADKIRLEKEKTEEILRERERRLETYTEAMERRAEELRILDGEMLRLISRKDPRSPSSPSSSIGRGLRKYLKLFKFDQWRSMNSSVAKLCMCFKN